MVIEALSHYRIIEKLGEGGMGEVYRAEDATLGREVALKCLPDEFTADPEGLARLEREARLLATLNHPNIAQIYSFERLEGRQFLVLELIEGDTLAERLRAGPIPTEEALELAIQIARALEAAHDRGIVHRDLKPSNIKVTPEGQVKVLDFGIAKPVASSWSPELTHSPTVPYPTTRAGLVFGTPAYMSPEQARGQPLDKRSDIWSYGVVLWEILTGEPLFQGPTDSDILAAVIQGRSHLRDLPSGTPHQVERTLGRCLESDPDARLHDIADARLDIQEALARPDKTRTTLAAITSAEAIRVPSFASRWAILGAMVLGAILAGSSMLWLTGDDAVEESRSRRWSVIVPEDLSDVANFRENLEVSPDGQWLVFSAKQGQTRRIFRRSIHRFEVTPIPGTEGAYTPFFSPDGRWIGFWSSTSKTLQKIPFDGGSPTTLADAPSLFGASWGPDDTIVYVPEDGQGIWRVSAVGGSADRVLQPSLDLGAWDLSSPEFLPDGDTILFTAWTGWTAASSFVGLLDLNTGEYEILLEKGSHAFYLPSGHLIYGHGDHLELVPFDLSRRQIVGRSVPVPERIWYDTILGLPHLAVSRDGSLYFLPGESPLLTSLVSVDIDRKETPIGVSRRDYFYPRYSPEGDRIAVAVMGSEGPDIWVIHLATGVESRLTTGGGHLNSLWTPDGARITFNRETTDPPMSLSIFWQQADGADEAQILLAAAEPGQQLSPHAWSPDGSMLVFGKTQLFGGQTTDELWLLDTRDQSTRPLLTSPRGSFFGSAAFSPDGRWLAYHLDWEVYVQPFPEGNERWQISTGGGTRPVWSADGARLYFDDPEYRIWVAQVALRSDFRASKPELFLDGPYSLGHFRLHPGFDVSPVDDQLVMVRDPRLDTQVREVRVVTNWLDTARLLAPPDGKNSR